MSDRFNSVPAKDVHSWQGRMWMEVREDGVAITIGNKYSATILNLHEARELLEWLRGAVPQGAPREDR
jgi:hypothetical protein